MSSCSCSNNIEDLKAYYLKEIEESHRKLKEELNNQKTESKNQFFSCNKELNSLKGDLSSCQTLINNYYKVSSEKIEDTKNSLTNYICLSNIKESE